MNNDLKISLIVPVYNRPDEVKELLESLTLQTDKDFEILIIEDGSTISCEKICEQYSQLLDIHYYFKPNSGPGKSRNYGVSKASGNYMIVLDSDVIVPENYISIVKNEIDKTNADAFGGPDRAHQSFSKIQKAINYSMTSFLTTGGIRGGKKRLDKFYPRSFNMGIRKTLFEQLNGFSDMRFGEDIDFSIRIYESNHKCMMFPDAWVYHKRRSTLKQFFKQVSNSGIARINLQKKHRGSLKIVHAFPSLFVIGVLALLILSIFSWYFILPIIFYIALIIIDSSIKNKNLIIGLYSVAAVFVQLFGYGIGFIHAFWTMMILKKEMHGYFKKTFYK